MFTVTGFNSNLLFKMGNKSGKDNFNVKDSVSASRNKLPLFCGCCKGKDEFDFQMDDDVGVKLEPKFK